MESVKRKRPYNSVRRKDQARQTRRQIVEAARKLFFERGYAGTSIEAIAQEAGVAVETVYAAFGNKRAILTTLVDYSVVGDDLPIPLLQRPDIQAARQETDQRRLIRTFVGDIYQIMGRMSPIFALLRTTAKTEPDIAALLDRLLKERLKGMAFFVENLARIGPLREGLDPSDAAETVWAITSAEMFQLLTSDLHWSEERYKLWLEETLVALLLA
jgi:AcrR family transcriptional regulator